MSRVWDSGGTAAFVSKIGAGRKLVKKGRREWEWKRDRSARALINRIKRETSKLFDTCMHAGNAGFEEAKRTVEAGSK